MLYTYVASSVLSVIAIVYYAFSTRGHFYPSVLYLASSKVALVVGGNMVVALSILFGQLLVKIFFNVLKDGEVEILIELLKYEAMETVFAFALFRNEISPQVVLFFLGLLFLKAFHLIAKTRVQYLEQVMPVSISTHVRLQGVILTLFAADLAIANYCVQSTLAGGSTILILFGFEFGLLVIAAFNTMTKYYLHVLDSYLSRGLVGKGLYIMILEVLCDAFRVVTYVMFFCLIYSYYGLPLHILREVWVSFVMFQRRLVSFIKYLKLIQNLETKFVSATPEEIADAGDCLVCRETMESGKKLPCGHVFHVDCLRMWLQHQQSCPLCRADIPVTGVGEQRAQEEPADAGDAAALRAVQNVIQAEAAAAAREAAMAAAEAAAVAEVVTTDTVTAVEDAATFHSTSVSTPVPDQQPIAEAEIMIETTEPGNHVNATPAVETSIEQSSVTELKRVAAGSPVDPYDITKSISATASPTVTPVKPAVSPVAPLNAKDATRARWANISLGSMAAKTEAASMSSPTPTRTSSVTVSSSAVLDLEVDVATGTDSERTVEEFPETFGGDIVISTPEKKPGEDLVNHSDDLGDTAFGEEPVGQQESPPVALSAPALTPVLAEKECADNVALSSASDIEREIMRLVTPSISVPIHPSTVVAAAAAAQPDSASTTASLIVGPYRHYALWVHTLPRFVMLVPGPAARANTQTSSGSSAISGSSSSDRSVDASTNTSIPPVCVFSMPGQALPVVRTFPNVSV